MNLRIVVALGIPYILIACQSDRATTQFDGLPKTPELPAEMRSALDKFAAKQGLGSDNWVEKDGTSECGGYLTKYENDDYCSSRVPDDWVTFEYEGQTYYVQPLAIK